MSQSVKKTQTYEEMISRLEEIATLLESGDRPLSEAVALYRESLSISEKCAKTLEKFRGTVSVIRNGKETETDDDGEL